MSDRDTQVRLNQMEQRVAQIERRTGNRPVREAIGGSGDSLPKGKGKYKVLMLIDDLDPATPDWDHIRFDSGE